MSWFWKRRTHTGEPGTTDEMEIWVREGLTIEVPADSFDRVWSRVQARLEHRAAPDLPPWELVLAVRRLRFWVRVLGAALAGATAVLLVLLVSRVERGVEPQPPARRAIEEEAGSLGWLSWSPSPADRDRAIKESYGLLKDNRVIYDRNIQRNGGL